jgi:hypothetical protein
MQVRSYAPSYKKGANGVHVVVSIRALGPHASALTRQSTMRYRVAVRVMPWLYTRSYIRIWQVDIQYSTADTKQIAPLSIFAGSVITEAEP